jgi:hypothetical protein
MKAQKIPNAKATLREKKEKKKSNDGDNNTDFKLYYRNIVAKTT